MPGRLPSGGGFLRCMGRGGRRCHSVVFIRLRRCGPSPALCRTAHCCHDQLGLRGLTDTHLTQAEGAPTPSPLRRLAKTSGKNSEARRRPRAQPVSRAVKVTFLCGISDRNLYFFWFFSLIFSGLGMSGPGGSGGGQISNTGNSGLRR